jgi:CubicO group peptidase (beta-lactamase class C family)
LYLAATGDTVALREMRWVELCQAKSTGGDLVTTETFFHVASITKPFVGTSVMQFAERNRLNTDAPITRYLPDFQLKDPRFRAITVRLMLTHTFGMPDVEEYVWDKPEVDGGALESDHGFLTAVVMLPARKTGVVVVVNADRSAIEPQALRVALGEDLRG